MGPISNAHIRRLDLTLMLTFSLLLRRRSMSQVAAELRVTQSAVSHAVARLRAIFEDPLFVREGGGVAPTPRALLLGPMLDAALDEVRRALSVGHHFDPSTAHRQFGLAAPDTVVAAISPRLLNELARAAPRCRLVCRMAPPHVAAAALAAGEVDIAIGRALDRPANAVGRPIASEAFGVAARKDHPLLGDGLDLETYCRLDHLLVSNDRDAHGIVDVLLGSLGHQRRVAAILPHLLLAFVAASQSDAVITAPLSACRYASTLFPVTIHDPPLQIPALELMLLRHADGMADPAIDWFEQVLVDALSAPDIIEG